ncbi:MAG: UbiA family prenyltransferase [Dyadobacter sp.]|uniref:UbiA family prenyltransferase n=1 Tax=Dyadobacter sp. TaxID=1914288 RepID=UPI001B150E7C|nr:UbiA family prenyltransferase [Dyadobacter sp.]MBO9611326.1 UbiA family prenyltransferase [Dyadobacter sp.]
MKHSSNKYYPIFSRLFCNAYFIHMRPYLLFVSGAAGAMGIAMGKAVGAPEWKCWLAFAPFFLGYGFGQALTDCFQTDTDKLSAPYRPLSQEIISIKSVLIVSISGLLASGLILLWLHPLSFALSIVAVLGLATYSFVKKHFWFGGPFYNAWIVMLLPVMGYFIAQPKDEWHFPIDNYGYIFITFFSYANFVLIGYLKDIEADQATNYKTFPVVLGWNRTVFTGDIFALVTLLLFWQQTELNVWSLAFGLAGSMVIVTGQVIAHQAREKNERGAMVPIASTVRGFILLHLAVILHFQPDWFWFALIFYSLFEWALYRRPSKYQI